MNSRLKSLKSIMGKNGKPTYFAYDGKVFDVSQSDLWRGGEHMNSHHAGKDITEELDRAPHGEEVLNRITVKLVGTLV